jgi:RNA polymerase sigma-54 factor
MKPTLQVRLSQHLALTPQLQQSIRLLQLSTLELQQEVEQMLDQNPFLEVDEDAPAPPEPMAERLSAAERTGEREAEQAQSAASGEDSAEPASLDQEDFGSTEREDWENGTERDDFDGIADVPNRSGSADDDAPTESNRSQGLSLHEHLRAQVLGMRLSEEDRAALWVLIESVNDDGYLTDSLDDIARALLGMPAADKEVAQQEGLTEGAEEAGKEAGGMTAPETDATALEDLLARLNCALRWLQSLDPIGVGARNLGECLALQMRRLPRSEAQIIAILICKQHLDLLARRDSKKLMAATGADENLLREAHSLITRLEPKPGRPFARAEEWVVVPDVIVQRRGHSWRATLNPEVMPRLRINELYAQALRSHKGEGSAPLSGHLQEARWFVKNVLQRFDTIQRVSQAIIERQRNFFTHGEIAMKPLVLREIADELGLHESTISRVTTAKYMATPHGTFELKYFFGSGLSTDTGGSASSTAVKALIKQFVAAEPAGQPLSDNQLAAMLEEQGIQVARRTVAKYREALKIAPANLRKAI